MKMNSIKNIKCIKCTVLLFLLACTVNAHDKAPAAPAPGAAPATGAKASGSGTFDVKDYGVVADGKTDCTAVSNYILFTY